MSLVGFKARNHPQQATRDDVDDRRTPRELFNRLHSFHRFTIDVAASGDNALLERFYTREMDGLSRSWTGERVWCNPPYSNIEVWVTKAVAEVRSGLCPVVVMLLPANRTEQGWWQDHIEIRRDGAEWEGVTITTHFIRGRLRMAPPSAPVPPKGDRPPFGCVLLIFRRAA